MAAIQVFEAILVAILVLTAILFFTSVQRPTSSQEALGINLGSIASDTLGILQAREFKDPDGGADLDLAAWVNRTLGGDADVQETVQKYIEEVLPSGTRYHLRFTNGVGQVTLLPADPPTPRAGRGAATYITPWWNESGDETFAASTQYVEPGGPLFEDPSLWTKLTSPSNGTTGPGGVPWQTWWAANAPDPTPEVPGDRYVPEAALLGTWKYEGGLCLVPPCHFHVGLNQTRTDHAVYGLHLVVWYGA